MSDIGDESYLRRTELRRRVLADLTTTLLALDEEFMGEGPPPVVDRMKRLIKQMDALEREQESDDSG